MKNTVMFILLMLSSLCLVAQEISVSGVVTNRSDGTPIPGVSIAVKNTTKGVVTDIDGNYTISANSGDVLVFSFIGFKTMELPVAGSSMDIELIEDFQDIDEVVIVGYGVKKKKLLTGANLNVKGEELAELKTSSAVEALQGIAPGVSVTRNNGAPGAGAKVVIRGLGTNGNSNPLYVVDGVPMGGIDHLNPSDIGSIDVLKDAASAAIYGSRAANGVILVTTKKAEAGTKPTVSYDGYFGIQNIYKNADPLNAQEYMYIMDEGRVNDGMSPNDWENEIVNGNSWLDNTFTGELGKDLGSKVWSDLQKGWKGTNWIDEMTKKDAPMQSHSVNIAGAGKDTKYALGFSYFQQDGIIGGDVTDAGYERITARMNTEFVLFKVDDRPVVTVGENLTFTNTENRSARTGNIYWNDLHNALVQHPLMPAYWSASPDQHGYTPTMEGISNDQHNPLASMFYSSNYNWGKGNNIKGNAYAIISPLEGLTLRSSYGLDTWFGYGRSWTPMYALGTMYQNATDGVSQNMYSGSGMTWTNTLEFKTDLGGHNIGLLAGHEMIQPKLNMGVSGSMVNSIFGKPEFAYLDNVKKENVTGINTGGYDYAAGGGGVLSYLGRFSYDYNERFMFDATFRADASSNFAEDNRWGYFPSFSAGWNFTEESFMDSFDWIDFGKLRASWGQNGNHNIEQYFVYTSNIKYMDPGYYFGANKPISSTTAIPKNAPNPDIKWETSEQLNIGLDAQFFNSKLYLTFDYYVKTTIDWLVVPPAKGTLGALPPYVNGGDVENKGVELVLSYNDQISDFRYGITVSAAHNKNEVLKLANAEGVMEGPDHTLSQGTAYVSRLEVGQPMGFFYGFEADGILQNQQEVDAYVGPEGDPYFTDQRPGDVRFVDQNNDGVIDENDKTYLGNPHPDLELGVQLNLEYKNLYLNTTLTGKFGMQVMRSYRSFADKFDQNYTSEIFDRWHGEGTSDRLPRLSSSSHRNTNNISDIFMHDADYLRINNLTVGYKLNDVLRDVNCVKAAKLYVAFNNLYTFTGYDGMDPEVAFGNGKPWASGIDLGLYPLPRTVMFGVNVTF